MRNEEFSYALLSNAFTLNHKSFPGESNPKLITNHYPLITDLSEVLR